MSEVFNFDFTTSSQNQLSSIGTVFKKKAQWAHKIWYKEIHFIAHSRQIYLFTYYQTSVLTLGVFVHACKPTTLVRKKNSKKLSLYVRTP